ncbi:MAG: HAD family phosphatase [Alphaproteobacteria bacterium]|jgi:beta-phosphoglucomutase-like phosphatase (HAD superfamily)|nr:HAD family phosphatase [Alphaproteobacteria bacterium]MDP7223336.1 HAD family phosphatase [Alphaproteobacteria bacterium]
MPQTPYDLIIFDCDGTLVDSEYLNCLSCSEIIREAGFDGYTVDYIYNKMVGMTLVDIRAAIEQKHGRKLPDDLRDRIIKRISQNAPTHLRRIDGALRMVSWADENGFPLCVASNGERPNVLESLRIAELDTYLPPERTFTADQDEVAKGKPAPDLFLYAASQTGGHDPARCLVIEDTTVGVRAAKSAGMTVFGLTSSHANIPGYDDRLREAGADAIMESWADFPAQIKDA